jgi:ABC-type glycerol-3-phosphate transport system permease component
MLYIWNMILWDVITCSNVHRMGTNTCILKYRNQIDVRSIKVYWNFAASCKAILIFPKICSFSFNVSRV